MTDTNTRSIPGRYYTDAEIFESELDRVFGHTWVMIGHVSQLRRPGDVLTGVVGRERVLVTNDGNGLHGFYNVCQHRGHELVAAGTSHVPLIVCPYHSWTYDLTGTLTRARRIPADALGTICVPRVRVDDMAGFVFVNLDLDAPPLSEYAPVAEDQLLTLAPDARERTLTATLTHTFDANWKLAVENYNECYHCPNVHRSFTAGVVDPATFMITASGNTVTHTARVAVGAAYDLALDSSEYGSVFTWPVSSIQCYPGRVLNTFRWVPLAVDRTVLIREWWFDVDVPTPAQRQIIDMDWATTVAEDFDLMESVQRNMSSRGFVPGPLMVDESGTADVHHENAVPHLQRLALRALGDAD